MSTCKNGHERTAENTRHDRDGYPVCRECHREARRRERARKAAAKPPREHRTYITYALEGDDGTVYVGVTSSLATRLERHRYNEWQPWVRDGIRADALTVVELESGIPFAYRYTKETEWQDRYKADGWVVLGDERKRLQEMGRRGAASKNPKITVDQVNTALDLLAKGKSQREVATACGVSQRTVGRIARDEREVGGGE
jgi:predicted GIY-YIG superfamily endonuclease